MSSDLRYFRGGGSLTTLHEHASRCRSRRLWLVLAGVLLLVVIWGSCWWWFVLKPVYDERRPFVGTWRLESPSPTFPARPELVNEMDLMFDGTIVTRLWNPQTGVVDINQPSPYRWQLRNGRYQEVCDDGDAVDKLLHGFGVSGGVRLVLDSPVTWEGPDRFRVQGPSPKRQIMIWSRSESVTDLPRTHIPIGPQ
jgi:hypothetical protein